MKRTVNLLFGLVLIVLSCSTQKVLPWYQETELPRTEESMTVINAKIDSLCAAENLESPVKNPKLWTSQFFLEEDVLRHQWYVVYPLKKQVCTILFTPRDSTYILFMKRD